MKMKNLVAALSGAFLIGAATLAPAQKTPSEPAKAAQPKQMENKTAGISGDQYKAEKDRIEADAKAAKEACKSMKDNAKDVCEAEAKGKEKLAKKELDYKKNPNDKNAQDVEKMKAEVAYELAKEKCEDMKGADLACDPEDAIVGHGFRHAGAGAVAGDVSVHRVLRCWFSSVVAGSRAELKLGQTAAVELIAGGE